MKKLRVLIVSISLMLGLLTGCGGAPANNNAEVPSENTPGTGSEAAWPRTYVDAVGNEIVLDKKPERIALLNFHNYEAIVALGQIPVAATDTETVYKGWGSLIPYAEKFEIIDVGATKAPNLEKLVEVNPDVILYIDSTQGAIVEDLKKIAPVIAVAGGPIPGYGENWSTWQGVIREYGMMLGEEAKAEAEIARLEGLLTDAKAKLAPYQDKTFVFIRLQEKDIYSWMPDFAFNPEKGIGLKSPYEKPGQLSLESLADLNPDFIILYDEITNTVDEDKLADLNANSSVWQSLTAVKAGQVIPVDRSAFSGGPLGMEIGIRALVEGLTSK
ncbi:Fe(3+)-citrate-binding protein YfmC [bioreactor metagenome]|uniref:Fe(3+)-citrate-binding protein YfmC n=1 Tax=bioreactor metagenome TaxID=1076179 RepID=A0A644TE83_9ZZZZ|nr:ABC transporter substrate-binding protein [Desulfitobacterium hafniense]MEA5025313.1 ABC transporter substrate-binding protein [Desulfitobacterium hafniense]